MKKYFILSIVLLLTACGGNVKQSLGLSQEAPDEFKVVSNLPLTVPPGYDLRPPRPGAKRPQQVDIDKQAEKVIFSETNANDISEEDISKGESFLLQQANANDANPNIKEILNEEERVLSSTQEEKGFIDKLSDKLIGKSENKDPLVNATLEKKRIEEDKKDGKEITGKETKEIEQKADTPLKRLLDW